MDAVINGIADGCGCAERGDTPETIAPPRRHPTGRAFGYSRLRLKAESDYGTRALDFVQARRAYTLNRYFS